MVLHSQRLIQFQLWLPQLVAGLLLGLTLTIDAIAVGLIIFSDLSVDALSIGLNLALASTAFVALVIALSSSFVIAEIAPSVEAAAILVTVASALSKDLPEPAMLPILLAAISLSSILTGGCLFIIGRFRFSRGVSPYLRSREPAQYSLLSLCRYLATTEAESS